MNEITYTVPGMSCAHCKAAVSAELQDLDTKLVVVRGDRLDDQPLRAPIDQAGYEAA
jgi:copper chaperone